MRAPAFCTSSPSRVPRIPPRAKCECGARGLAGGRPGGGVSVGGSWGRGQEAEPPPGAGPEGGAPSRGGARRRSPSQGRGRGPRGDRPGSTGGRGMCLCAAASSMGWWSWRPSAPCATTRRWTTMRWAFHCSPFMTSLVRRPPGQTLFPASKLPGLATLAPWKCHTQGARLPLPTTLCRPTLSSDRLQNPPPELLGCGGLPWKGLKGCGGKRFGEQD